jgi:hypothetical protein
MMHDEGGCQYVIKVSANFPGDGDEGRLRELCEELLGPVRRGSQEAAACSSADAAPAAAAGPSSSGGGGGADAGAAAAGQRGFDFELDRRQLLREDVLREMSRNRGLQRLVAEFQELLAEGG